MIRREKFGISSIFHIFNKSIADYGIFRDPRNGYRFIETLDYYNDINRNLRFSKAKKQKKFVYKNVLLPKKNPFVKFISFCIMPNHYHLLVKVLVDNAISKFIGNIENSFTRYFNLKFNRKGPLWQSQFRTKRINTDEELLHISRYIHLNPTTSNLVNKPEDWSFSSYRDIIGETELLQNVITEISIRNKSAYKQFVENNIDYQIRLKQIKKLTLE